MSRTDQYLVEANPDFRHDYMHMSSILRNGDDLIKSFYASLWGVEGMTREAQQHVLPAG